MERRQLEVFLTVCDRRNMAEAARDLHMSQPALSHTIKALEKSVGTPLFHRLPRGVRLTSAGESLRLPAAQIVSDFAIAAERVRAVRGLRGGSLDVVSLPGLVTSPLAPWLGRFGKHWPGIEVRIEQMETPEQVTQMIRSGRAEVGLTVGDATEAELVFTRVDTQELVAVLPAASGERLDAARDPGSAAAPASPRSSITLAELMREGLITGKRGTLIRDLAEAAALADGTPWHPVIEVERREAALAFVHAGAGAAVLPRASGEQARHSGLRVLSLAPRIRRPIFVLHRASPLSPAAGAFLDLVTSILPER